MEDQQLQEITGLRRELDEAHADLDALIDLKKERDRLREELAESDAAWAKLHGPCCFCVFCERHIQALAGGEGVIESTDKANRHVLVYVGGKDQGGILIADLPVEVREYFQALPDAGGEGA